MKLTLIAAVAANRIIGKDGQMPWHYPEDLRHFKEQTMGHPVIVGRITYEAIATQIGGPLPGRTNIVLTSSPDRVETTDAGSDETTDDTIDETTDEPTDGTAVVVATTVEEALALAEETGTDEVFVAGGASVYEQFLPRADRLELTELQDSYEGDTKFPAWDEENWEVVDRDDREELSFVTYRRESRGASGR